MRRELRVSDAARASLERSFADPEPNPFLRYRRLFHSYALTHQLGGDDALFVDVVRDLDARVERLVGTGFRETPFAPAPPLAERVGCGELRVKDETANVGGTHKGRHLAGVMVWLLLAERLTGAERDRLAISSCGNAAWAATILAKSVDWPIDVFVPEDGPAEILARMADTGATLARCERRPDEAGDPCYLRFGEALAAGALPFTCQGPSNGLVIEGGQTLVWEIVSTLLRSGDAIDRLLVQTGGGALASACVLGWCEARQVTPIGRLPKLHAVQTSGAWPLLRAYDAAAARLADRFPDLAGRRPQGLAERDELATELCERLTPEAIREELGYAATHRSEFMWPWETTPHSVADAILDDETYDWLPVLSGMLESGGYPIVVSEELLLEANRVVLEGAGIEASATGSAGLAGALALAEAGRVGGAERVAILATGGR